MSEERRKRFNSIGFTWKIRGANASVLWDFRFQELLDYKRVHGDCNLPQKYKANPQLGTWVDTQRRSKTMSEERRKILNSIGFNWKVREPNISVPWEVHFQQLVEYKPVHGHCNVSTLDQASKQLGIWVYHQGQNKETMSEIRRNQLNSIGFVWRLAPGPKRARNSTVEDPKKKKKRVEGGSRSRRHGCWTTSLGFLFRTAS